MAKTDGASRTLVQSTLTEPTPASLSRRQVLSQAGKLAGGATVLAVNGAAAAGVFSATEAAADRLPDLWRQWRTLEAERAAAQAALDAKRDELHAVNLFQPRVRIGTYWEGARGVGPNGDPAIPGSPIYAYSEEQICLGYSRDDIRARWLAEFRQSASACDNAKALYGFDALFAATRAAEDRLWDLDKVIEETEPVSIAGLVAKLQYVGKLTLSISGDDDDWGGAVLRRTIADAETLAKHGVA